MGQWGDVPRRCPPHVPPCRSQEARQAENTCTLADLPEGQVGKLLVRKSGKVQLVLGKVTLDVTMGTPCSFLQVWGGAGDLIPEVAPGVVPGTNEGSRVVLLLWGWGWQRGKDPAPVSPCYPHPGDISSRTCPPKAVRDLSLSPPVVKGFPMGMGRSRVSPPPEQELVSVGIGDNRTGEMIVLGHVKHKLVCSPDFEALLEHRHR